MYHKVNLLSTYQLYTKTTKASSGFFHNGEICRRRWPLMLLTTMYHRAETLSRCQFCRKIKRVRHPTDFTCCSEQWRKFHRQCPTIKNEDVTQAPDAGEHTAPEMTAKADLPSPSPNNNVTQSEPVVNTQYMQDGADYAQGVSENARNLRFDGVSGEGATLFLRLVAKRHRRATWARVWGLWVVTPHPLHFVQHLLLKEKAWRAKICILCVTILTERCIMKKI